jgi:hypothetical protein
MTYSRELRNIRRSKKRGVFSLVYASGGSSSGEGGMVW